MATYFYGINLGQNEYQATIAATTQSNDVELKVTSTNVPNKNDVLVALERIYEYLVQSVFLPAASGNWFYGTNVGAHLEDVSSTLASQNSSPGNDYELRVNLTNVTTKEDVLLSIEKLLNWVLRNGYPPL